MTTKCKEKKMLFEIKDVDRKTYEEQLRDFMPEKIIDMHGHTYLKEHFDPEFLKRMPNSWWSRVAKQQSMDELLETYELMFPGKEVTSLVFWGACNTNDSLDEYNDYVREVTNKHNFPALIFSRPNWTAEELEEKIIAGKFLGVKAYQCFAPEYIPLNEIRIFDFFPPHHLEVMNRHGWMMMLHVPRPGRLGDPVNLAQLLEIENKYPNIKLVVAHVGCTYYPEAIGDAFEVLAKTKNMMFEISANTHAPAFEKLINCVGPKRIMFGADMPILRMRMRRISENGSYVNIIPKGLYGDVSDDARMREVEGTEAEALTFFMYEEIKAFKQAAEKTGLSRSDIEDVFYNNARQLIDTVSATIK